MCGIFGIIPKTNNKLTLLPILNRLYLQSSSRGKDASGIAVLDSNNIFVYKESLPPWKFIKTTKYRELLKNSNIQALFGHARMETNGSFSISENNQPVVNDGVVTIHNGIIVNDTQLWKSHSQLKRKFQVDTEIFNSLLRNFLSKHISINQSITKVYRLIEGSASTASFFHDLNILLLSTNTGSLYIINTPEFFIFASEFSILASLIDHKLINTTHSSIKQLKPNTYLVVNLATVKIIHNSLQKSLTSPKYPIHKRRTLIFSSAIKKRLSQPNTNKLKIISDITLKEFEKNLPKINSLRRCTRCILPETMPFIEFDSKGVCNYCHNYTKIQLKGKPSLEKIIKPYRDFSSDRPNCIVTFSGGRDSSYGLHYVKKELGLNPVAYSYDWGMLTDLGRRNQARMTGKLGVEHILISADITQKRSFIKKNVEAWLKHPDLGTVPLFMAGDKQYFYYANELRTQMGIDLVFLFENSLEKTDFKYGFCGVSPVKRETSKKYYAIPTSGKLKMMFYYAQQYITNPSYINNSLFDSIWAFFSYYGIKHDYISLYDYVPWKEKVVEHTLLHDYNWEIASDTPTTWRIGDGTAAFYNYIYYTMAGLSENDTFRSNQIREGDITRSDALKIAKRDNRVRVESLIWYANTVNFDLNKALLTINKAPKLY